MKMCKVLRLFWKNTQRRFSRWRDQGTAEAIKPWVLQKGAQYETASGRGCVWYAESC